MSVTVVDPNNFNYMLGVNSDGSINIAATSLPLPTNAALETGGNLAALVNRSPVLGSQTIANSSAVCIASDQIVPTTWGPSNTATYSVAGVIPINTILLTVDLLQFRGLSIHCTSMGTSGVVTPEWSGDNTNWITATLTSQSGGTASNFSAATLWLVPKQARYFRLRLSTATTAGNTNILVESFQTAPQFWLPQQSVLLQTTSNLAGDFGVQYRSSSTGAATIAPVMSPLVPAAGTAKSSAGRLLGWQLQNSSASLRSVKIFNVVSPTLGTTAAVFEIDIPAGQLIEFMAEGGLSFSTAITWSVTSAKGLTDNTSTGLAANDVSGFLIYQ